MPGGMFTFQLIVLVNVDEADAGNIYGDGSWVVLSKYLATTAVMSRDGPILPVVKE